MNILREVRRVRNKSMPVRIILLLAFCVIFVVTTYAWFSTQKDVTLGGLHGDVTSWDVSYYVNQEGNIFLDKTAVFTIEQLYPGMPNREDVVHIYNIGESSTNITYELVSVKVFGQEVLNELDIGVSGNTRTIFSADTEYPFCISYTYDKNYLEDQYEDEVATPNSKATFRFNVSWPYEGQGTEAENLAKDILDTKFGKDAYAYYSNAANDPTKAIEVQVKITSSMAKSNLKD